MQITREDLDNYQKIKAEIRALKYRIDQIRYSSPSPKEVIGGRSSATVPSNPTEQKALDLAEKETLLEERLRSQMLYQARIERFVYYDCTDPVVRNIIAIHYLEGRTWAQTSWICFRSTNKSTSQMVVHRYFKENNEE